jgi:NIMA (never in mitosis gene a)-related kinase
VNHSLPGPIVCNVGVGLGVGVGMSAQSSGGVQSWEAKIREAGYAPIKRVGKGATGAAILVRTIADDSVAVVKYVKLGDLSPQAKDALQLEVALLKKLSHPHILRYRDTFVDTLNNALCIVTDFCEGGDLAKYLQDHKDRPIEQDVVLRWFSQLACAINYLHDNKILHRDLKTANIFLSNDDLILGDFGMARQLESTLANAQTLVGTPLYMSPEILQNKPYNKKADLWALGCILYEMCTFRYPFESKTLDQLFDRVFKNDYIPIPAMYSPNVRELVKRLLMLDPEKRPDAAKVPTAPIPAKAGYACT